MALAESLLRVPDDSTLDRLIVDKLAAGAFDRHAPASDALLVQACAFALGVSTKTVRRGGDAARASSPMSRDVSACRRCAARRGRR